ncbi:hypothetical protein TI39_contig395g00002 [Zymoseptoria brevis]|uniref:Uncharacterized protein n=1 Tax=Zymoseptoria brevis TaxID=1047168 RepID=A0A0F4GNT7_9PEZI|nr:hypothetical protein TI39_contig395g00002 [Zymoseptoria brevis]
MKLLLIAYALGLAHAAAVAVTSPNDEAGVSLEARDDCPDLYTCYNNGSCHKHERAWNCLRGHARYRECPSDMTNCPTAVRFARPDTPMPPMELGADDRPNGPRNEATAEATENFGPHARPRTCGKEGECSEAREHLNNTRDSPAGIKLRHFVS